MICISEWSVVSEEYHSLLTTHKICYLTQPNYNKMAEIKTTGSTSSKENYIKPTPSIFSKENYTWMGIGAVVITIGMFLMAGGGSKDPSVFNKDEVYSTTRITIAPILILAGLVIEIYAIFKKPKTQS